MRGTRVSDRSPHLLEIGEYARWPDDGNSWHARTPSPFDLTANLGSHQVVEHEDGTITASPSILVTDGAAGHSWHGFLEHGVWREC